MLPAYWKQNSHEKQPNKFAAFFQIWTQGFVLCSKFHGPFAEQLSAWKAALTKTRMGIKLFIHERKRNRRDEERKKGGKKKGRGAQESEERRPPRECLVAKKYPRKDRAIVFSSTENGETGKIFRKFAFGKKKSFRFITCVFPFASRAGEKSWLQSESCKKGSLSFKKLISWLSSGLSKVCCTFGPDFFTSPNGQFCAPGPKKRGLSLKDGKSW